MAPSKSKGSEEMERRGCSAEGCTNKPQSNGKCRTHTGGGGCSQPGCDKQAQFKGLCVAHGGRRICTHPDCNRTVASKGKCSQHGGSRRRNYSDKAASGDKTEDFGFVSGEVVVPTQESMLSLLMEGWPQGMEVSQQTMYSDGNMPNFQAADQYSNDKFSHSEPAFVSAGAVAPISSTQEKESHASMMSLLLEEWPHEMANESESGRVQDLIEAADNIPTTSEDTRPRKSRNRARCTNPGCTKIAQSEGLCVGHGGKRCSHPGCIKGAQYKGLCIAHGGWKTCLYPSCTKMVRSYGRCFEHGGGKQCSQSGCVKQAQLSGRCHTHRDKSCLSVDGAQS